MTILQKTWEILKIIISALLSAGILLMVYSFTKKDNQDSLHQDEIDSKASIEYVNGKDKEIIREMKEEDTEIRGEMENMEVRFNKGDDRILEQMKADKLELIETIKMNN